MSVIKASASIIVQQPIEEVFHAFLNPDTFTEWFGMAEEIRDFSGHPIRVGTTYKGVGRVMGQEIINAAEITEYAPPHHVVVTTDSPVIRGRNIMDFERTADGGTKVSIALDGEAAGMLARMALPILKGQIQNQMNGDLQRFKRMIEK
jgi:uncharacterized protein YndB with AHSA1/START domain